MLSPHCEDDGPRFVCSHVCGDFLDISVKVELCDGLCHELSTEVLCVLLHFHGQIRSADAREPRIIVNFICVYDLAAAHKVLFDDNEVELCAGRVDGCRKAGGAGSDDN